MSARLRPSPLPPLGLPSRLPRPVRLGLYGLATMILAVLCILPNRDLPDPGTGDRFEHMAAWFVLTVTGYILAPRRRIAIPLFALAYGVLIEVVQRLTPTGRTGDPKDFMADAVGVTVAIAVWFGSQALAGAFAKRRRAP